MQFGGHMHGQARDRGEVPAMREQFYVLLRTGIEVNGKDAESDGDCGHQPLP